MFGHRFFGARHFGPHYFGPGVQVAGGGGGGSSGSPGSLTGGRRFPGVVFGPNKHFPQQNETDWQDQTPERKPFDREAYDRALLRKIDEEYGNDEPIAIEIVEEPLSPEERLFKETIGRNLLYVMAPRVPAAQADGAWSPRQIMMLALLADAATEDE